MRTITVQDALASGGAAVPGVRLAGAVGVAAACHGAIVGNLFALVMVAVTCVRARRVQMRYSFGPSLIAGALAVVLIHG